MLNSWELLCFILTKHIGTLVNLKDSFYSNEQEQMFQTGDPKVKLRADDSRLANIVLTKLLSYCQHMKEQADVLSDLKF